MAGNIAAAAGCAAGYLIGSVPFGLIVGKAVGGKDVRDFGSGNTGATNVVRTIGARAGAAPTAKAAAGLAACIGHSWPVFARFRGGKAVATAAGALIVVSPEAFAFAAAGGIGGLVLTRTVSVGSLAAAGVGTVGGALA